METFSNEKQIHDFVEKIFTEKPANVTETVWKRGLKIMLNR